MRAPFTSRSLLFLLAGCTIAACGTRDAPPTGEPATDSGPIDPPPSERRDAGPDAGETPPPPMPDMGMLVDSGCPAPAHLTPSDVPAGYLAAETVRLDHAADGDTATFGFPSSGEHVIRFLYVNTEESHGDATTDFGIQTGSLVMSRLAAASEIVVAPRESARNPGQPDLDPYDRWLGLVFVDGELFETTLLREGLTAYYVEFGCAPEPLHSAFLNAEAEARANGRGIWAAGHPTDYRDVISEWNDDGCRPYYDQPYCE